MLQSLQQLLGTDLGASDGQIGHVKDLYFDDRKWVIRYVVVDTGSWLSGRLVLLSPHAFGELHRAGKLLHANLSRKQIEKSPAAETHKPVSRQYEEEYYRYYGWPAYWEGSGMWGMSGFPIMNPPEKPPMSEQAVLLGLQTPGPDAHLRSIHAVTGYELETDDGAIGHITDFLMDVRSWEIRHLILKTGHWLSGKKVCIDIKHVTRVSYEQSAVLVDLSREAVQHSPEYQPDKSLVTH